MKTTYGEHKYACVEKSMSRIRKLTNPSQTYLLENRIRNVCYFGKKNKYVLWSQEAYNINREKTGIEYVYSVNKYSEN